MSNLLTLGDATLRTDDLALLVPPAWLNDALISFWLEHLTAHVLPPDARAVLLPPNLAFFLALCNGPYALPRAALGILGNPLRPPAPTCNTPTRAASCATCRSATPSSRSCRSTTASRATRPPWRRPAARTGASWCWSGARGRSSTSTRSRVAPTARSPPRSPQSCSASCSCQARPASPSTFRCSRTATTVALTCASSQRTWCANIWTTAASRTCTLMLCRRHPRMSRRSGRRSVSLCAASSTSASGGKRAKGLRGHGSNTRAVALKALASFTKDVHQNPDATATKSDSTNTPPPCKYTRPSPVSRLGSHRAPLPHREAALQKINLSPLPSPPGVSPPPTFFHLLVNLRCKNDRFQVGRPVH
ncbi:unnamed protein product [Chondrus crispus]|uniref:Uncharacterized protein n=1 Tax=Chondrus crispus TaxID=2769 RepID=R7QHU5_CHOCR|nr:unnamed protein product [Chondrus crispus]CDF38087.1 unnamed protein product [Chondrus crispus]|eukprot:XP_005717956.1 unnamed protein product [Chondrus crispus]